jgi:cytosine/adenosine deaminase-related metal-dependent hydrolase
MQARLVSRFLALAPLSIALCGAAGCGDNLGRRGGQGAEGDAGARPDAGADGEPDGGGGEPDGGGGSAIVTCPAEIPAAAEGACDVQEGSGSAVLLRGTVLGRDTVYENGAVLYDGGEIACVGCDCADAPAAADATRVDCAGAVISPGLINPHDHITFTEGEPIDHGATRYNHRHDWRGALSAPQNPHGTGATSAGTRWGELRMALSGVTSMVGSGSATGLVRNLDRAADADALGLDQVEFETFSLGDSNEQFHADCTWNYAIDEASAAELHAFLPHVAEGINNYAAEEFRCQSTSFDGGQDFTERNDSHIHGIGLDAAGYARMARDRTRLIWSPRSNISLYGHTAQVTTFDRLGGVIALGTDWTYSGSVNMVRELACADQFNRDQLGGHFTDEELWRMATWNAAVASGSDAELGSIEVGKRADLAVFAAAAGQHHRAVLEAEAQDTLLVLIGGRPVFGEADVVAGLGESCEALDVCGQPRAVCAARELGVAYADLAAQVAAGNPAYPAFFCGAPDGEPTCVPSRPGEFSGVAGPGDGDGDGVSDGDDNCPSVFNPVRPIDGGAQSDEDGDGEGDACDASPIGGDLDGDGVGNAGDNCPFDANPDQRDGDRDDKGDACDPCPDQANPLTVCGPDAVTIGAIQSGTVAAGTRVRVTGSVVTGVWSLGVFVQDPNGGTTNAGIHVFTGSNAGVSVGDIVDVSGRVTEFFTETELDQAAVTRTGTGGVIAPVDVTVAEAATEPYEGMLVRLTDITAVVNPYDCSADNPMCSDARLWLVNGAIAVYDRLYQDADWDTRAGQSPVVGVMGFRFDRRRIMPRNGTDIGP